MPATAPTTHVVVLAAGRGSRLGALGDLTPKWLLPVGGRTIAERQLEGIALAARAVAAIHVVVGHAADAITGELARRPEAVGVIRNPEFAELNNWWSLLLALRALPEDAAVVVINADLLAAPEQIAAFVLDTSAGPAAAVLAVDFERTLTDESMKVSARADGVLDRIGKVDVDAPVGEYVGMLMVRGDALRRVRTVLEGFVGQPRRGDEWYERAVGTTAADGLAWELWPMPSSGWVEIDDDADLDAAEALVGRA